LVFDALMKLSHIDAEEIGKNDAEKAG
jgi:hypothetical protein